MEILKEFHGAETVQLKGDLRIAGPDILKLNFEWHDVDGEIVFPKSPDSGRHFNLWQQTCFEAFVQLQSGEYFEINLSPNGAWNVYRFDSYRSPQPPQEYSGAELLESSFTSGKIEARFLIPGSDLKKIKAGLTAVLLLSNTRTTYWATKHSGPKPDFHLSENFNLERNL